MYCIAKMLWTPDGLNAIFDGKNAFLDDVKKTRPSWKKIELQEEGGELKANKQTNIVRNPINALWWYLKKCRLVTANLALYIHLN